MNAPSAARDQSPAHAAWRQFVSGVATQSWLASLVIHLTIFIVLALILGTIQAAKMIADAPLLQPADMAAQTPADFEAFELGDAPLEPSIIDLSALAQSRSPVEIIEGQFDASADFAPESGGANPEAPPIGMSDFNMIARNPGPMFRSFDPGIGRGAGERTGFAGRDPITRANRLGGSGATPDTELAVAVALRWIARHQNPDGSWSLDHTPRCKGGFCSGPGDAKSDSGATALGLLPFLAAGQTHHSKGPYQKQIKAGVEWLIRSQKPNGDLSGGASQMYSHGLATIALCEAYGMTSDSRVGMAAQRAIHFIESGQNAQGAWRYTHGSEDSDTSVFGWQVMALKSGQMAGLKVNPEVMSKAKGFLKLVSSGPYKERYGYIPQREGTPAMTSVGLLTSQYLGATRNDPAVRGGVEYLLQNGPAAGSRNTYYWYYATQAMHNVQGHEWDKWNRQMRRLLIETQDRTNCAAGSWSPDRPVPDAWGGPGGRLMITSLSCLTLEVYYRYLPLYSLDEKNEDLPKLP